MLGHCNPRGCSSLSSDSEKSSPFYFLPSDPPESSLPVWAPQLSSVSKGRVPAPQPRAPSPTPPSYFLSNSLHSAVTSAVTRTVKLQARITSHAPFRVLRRWLTHKPLVLPAISCPHTLIQDRKATLAQGQKLWPSGAHDHVAKTDFPKSVRAVYLSEGLWSNEACPQQRSTGRHWPVRSSLACVPVCICREEYPP